MTTEDAESPPSEATADYWRLVIRPASPDSVVLRTTRIPAGTANAVKKRTDQYLSELCKYMTHADPDRVRERVGELAGVYHASVWDYESSSTIAERRKRIRAMLAAMLKVEEAGAAIFETFTNMVDDDLDFCKGAFGTALSKFFDTVKDTKAELQRECDKLGEPRQGERARVDWPPLQKFLLMAELLWKNEVRTDPKSEPGYHAWLQLLFEIVTGEKERPFTRALADYRTRLRPVSRR